MSYFAPEKKSKNYFISGYFSGMCAKHVQSMDWSPKKRDTAIALRKEGYSYREVVAKLGHGVTPSGIR